MTLKNTVGLGDKDASFGKLVEAEVVQSCQNDVHMRLTVPVDLSKTSVVASCCFND